MEKIKLAVVEDHDKLREALILNLALNNFDVVIQAENGLVLLDKLKIFDVDIVILDISMPIMNGYDTLINLQDQYPHLKVIMYSSMAEIPIMEEFKKLGAKSFVSKNADFKDLVETIFKVNEN
jgi:DNA-binding NarL/FixJ family response regulator